MEEIKPNGDSTLRDSATIADMESALKELEAGRLSQVHIYRPGEKVTLKSGAKYRIGEHGNWIREQE